MMKTRFAIRDEVDDAGGSWPGGRIIGDRAVKIVGFVRLGELYGFLNCRDEKDDEGSGICWFCRERIVTFRLSDGFGGGCYLAMCLGQGRFHSSPVSRSK